MDAEKLKQQVGGTLARLRKERGFTQEKLAHESGLEVTTVASIERARRLPSVPSLVKLARVLKSTPNDLLGTTRSPAMAENDKKLYALVQFLTGRKVAEIDLVMDVAKRVLTG